MSGIKPELEAEGSEGQAVRKLEFRVCGYKNSHLAYFYNSSDQEMRFSFEPHFAFSQILDRRTGTVLGGRQMILPEGETAILEFR